MIDAAPTGPEPSAPKQQDSAPEEGTADSQQIPDRLRSGLANPQRAIAGLGACILALEALVLLLAIVPLQMLRVEPLGLVIGVVLFLVVVCVALAGMIRRGWAWHAASAVQLILLACGFFSWALAGVGLIFGATWWFAFSVRRKLSRPPVRD